MAIHFYALAFYSTFALIVGGIAYKIRFYCITPVMLKIPFNVATLTKKVVILRLASEVFYFVRNYKQSQSNAKVTAGI